MLGWDAVKKKISGFNFGMDGTIGWGLETDGTDKNTLVTEGSTTGPYKDFRATLKRVDEDTIEAFLEMKKDDKYVPMGPKMTYKRRK